MPTSSKYRGVVRFDGFEPDLASGQLRRDGISLRLQPQPTKVLVELVGRAGEVVSRKELADQVWGSETFVDFEQGLNFAIRQIHTALGDDADQPRFLETLPKRGYRFIRPVEEATPQSEPVPEKPAPSSFRWAPSSRGVCAVECDGVSLVETRTSDGSASHHSSGSASIRRLEPSSLNNILLTDSPKN
jgi:DNA-binding winged helix-turn-helix (wHTH) protein